MADYFQVKNQNIFNPPANTSLGNATNQFNDVYVQNDLVLGNVTVTGDTIIAPRVTTITYPGDDTAADTAGGQTITLTGTGFVAGANILINGSAVGVVSVVSSTTITFTSPANATGSYVIYVVNPDGSTAIAIPGIQYSGTPNWTTAAGTLGNVYETANFTQTVTATGDAPITYSVTSGSIPPGSTFNANGTITGTSQLTASPTTYSFTVRATDAEAQDTDRAFSISVIPDVVTWSNPTANATYSPAANIAIANITLSATSAVGSGITYSANTLPTGLSLIGANISGTPTVVANTSSLLTATANTTSESSSITINWSVSVASDPYFMYNSLLLPGTGTNGAQNNTFVDGSTNNFAITRAGNTTQGTFSPYGPNWSTFFGASTSNRISAPANAAFAFGTGAFTVEAWIYITNLTAENFIFDTRSSVSTSGVGFSIEPNTGKLRYSGNANNVLTSTGITANTWYHVAWVYNGTTLTGYINGVSGGTATPSFNITQNNGEIGNVPFSGVATAAYLSNVRVVKGTAVYTSNFTPSTTPLTAISGTSLLACQSNRFIDNSSNAFALTVSGTPTIQRFSPFSPTATYSTSTIGGSGYFDGSGDYVYAAANAAFNIGSNNASVEMWCYSTSSAADVSLCGQNSGPYSTIRLLQLSGNYAYTINDDTIRTTSIPVTLNAWMHIVVTITGGTGRMFVNGVLRNVTTGLGSVRTQSDAYVIGAEEGIANYYTGYMSDFRFVNGSIPTSYQTSSVTTGTTIFTPPTAPVTAIANTSLLLNFTNAGIIDNTMINNLETVGNAQISTAQTKFGGGSMSFDGTGDYLKGIASNTRDFGTSNFTIELWVYHNVLKNYSGLIGDIGGTITTINLYTYADGKFGVTVLGTNEQMQTATGVAVAATWQHIALVRSSGVVTLYVDGVSKATYTSSVNMQVGNGSGLSIGSSTGTGDFNGYIDDLRITKGIARYTSNFTPPIAAFPTY